MIRTFLARAAALLSLAVSLSVLAPMPVVAQATPLEGIEWHLVSYSDGDRAISVPWHIRANIRLDEGQLVGYGGCNLISGTYELDGQEISFSEASGALADCPSPDASAVEGGLANLLPGVASWATTPSLPGDEAASRLLFTDADGKTLLTFQRPVLSLTEDDIDQLAELLAEQQTAIDLLDQRLDNVRIGTLRDRLSALEDALRETSGPDLSTFSAAEQVLFGAVRSDIAETCLPRRSDNPAGTIAALQCKPDAPEVLDMAYYLMESDDAASVYEQRMKEHKVKNGTRNRSCAFGKPSQMAWVGGGIEVAGCYRNEDGRANLRFVNTLAECRQLTAGSTQVKNPSIYIAVLGPDRDITSLYNWAASSTDWEAGDDLFDTIRQPGQPWSDQCPHD